MRVQVPAEVTQVFVGPGGACLAIKTGLRVLAIPAEAETIAVHAGGSFQGTLALGNQRVFGLRNVRLERRRFSSVCDPAAHLGVSGAVQDTDRPARKAN